MSFDWQIAFALELLVIVFGFGLWFKAAKAEAGPKKLGRVAAVALIILAVLLSACTLSKAFLAYKEAKDAHVKSAECTGTCPDCTLERGGGRGGPCPPGNRGNECGGTCPGKGRGGGEPCGRATPCGTCLEKGKTGGGTK